jgi:hypothetical protein
MDAEERDVCNYLKSFPGQFVSPREICRRAGGKWKYRENPEWATASLNSLLEKGIVETDSTGHYRYKRKEKDKRPTKWISPQVKAILKKSGKDFDKIIEIEDPDEP